MHGYIIDICNYNILKLNHLYKLYITSLVQDIFTRPEKILLYSTQWL